MENENVQEKVAFFDFCDTLVPFQSADAYVNYVLKQHKSFPTIFRSLLLNFLHKIHLLNRFIRLIKTTKKAIYLWQLKGIPEDIMQSCAQRFYNECIMPNLIMTTYNRLKSLQNNGYRIVIVSGGYDIYLNLFAEDNHIPFSDVLSTELLFDNNKFTGKMGEDCMGYNKVLRIEKMFSKEKIYSISFSDSITDLPLLTWTDESYLILSTSIYKVTTNATPTLNIVYI